MGFWLSLRDAYVVTVVYRITIRDHHTPPISLSFYISLVSYLSECVDLFPVFHDVLRRLSIDSRQRHQFLFRRCVYVKQVTSPIHTERGLRCCPSSIGEAEGGAEVASVATTTSSSSHHPSPLRHPRMVLLATVRILRTDAATVAWKRNTRGHAHAQSSDIGRHRWNIDDDTMQRKTISPPSSSSQVLLAKAQTLGRVRLSGLDRMWYTGRT